MELEVLSFGESNVLVMVLVVGDFEEVAVEDLVEASSIGNQKLLRC